MLSSFQAGVPVLQQGRTFLTQRNSHQMQTTQPIFTGSMALDLENGLSRFGTWKKFNADFEKKLHRKERETCMRIKR